jgi:hypothetical protein
MTTGADRVRSAILPPGSHSKVPWGAAVNALLSYLVDAGYLTGNPLSLIRRRTRELKPESQESMALERFLDQETWLYLKQYIAELLQETPRQIVHFERVRFLFYFLYLLAPCQ